MFFSAFPADYKVDQDGWNFYNFNTTDNLDTLWTIYSKAFLGVSPYRSSASFDDITFFDQLVSRYAGHASCFGMSMMSIVCYKEGGHLAVCCPCYMYEGDLDNNTSFGPDMYTVRESISIMHLRQLTQPMITRIIDMVNSNDYLNPEEQFYDIRTSIYSGDLPLLSFMPGDVSSVSSAISGTEEAHTIVPYAVGETTSKWHIYCYDPNRPYSQHNSWYDSPGNVNYVEIDKSSKKWKYPANYTSSSTYGWQGGTSGPWTFIGTSISDAKYKDNHPLNVNYLLAEIGSFIFSNGATVTQITDSEGKHLYKQVGGKIFYEPDPSKRIPNLVRWPYFGSNAIKRDEIYFGREMTGKSFNIEIESDSKSYTCDFLKSGHYIQLSIPKGAAGKDELRINKIGSKTQVVELVSKRKLKNIKMEIVKRIPNTKIVRKFRINDLNIQKDSPVEVSLRDNFQAVQLLSKNKDISYSLEFRQKVKGKEQVFKSQRIINTAGQIQIARPSNWKELDRKDIELKVWKQEVQPKINQR